MWCKHGSLHCWASWAKTPGYFSFLLCQESRFCVSEEEIRYLGSFPPGKGLYRLSCVYWNVRPFLKINLESNRHGQSTALFNWFSTLRFQHDAAEAEFLEEIQAKVLLAIHSHLFSLALRFLFLQTHTTSYSFYRSTTVHCIGERNKPDRKSYHVFNDLRNPYRNLKSENSRDFAKKPQRNWTFMNSTSFFMIMSYIIKISKH